MCGLKFSLYIITIIVWFALAIVCQWSRLFIWLRQSWWFNLWVQPYENELLQFDMWLSWKRPLERLPMLCPSTRLTYSTIWEFPLMCNMEVKKPFSILILHQHGVSSWLQLRPLSPALLCMTAEEEDHSLNVWWIKCYYVFDWRKTDCKMEEKECYIHARKVDRCLWSPNM